MKYKVYYLQGQYSDCSGRQAPKTAIVSAPNADEACEIIRSTKERVSLIHKVEEYPMQEMGTR